MTNINCSKNCKYQSDGKCSCDSVILPFINGAQTGDSDCPYRTEDKSLNKIKELQ
ncbi:MAG: hypothetical protein IJF61_05780 [Clostridia bacterium]|nr:hypothetical protein [Clostridia bacterium]